MNIFGLIKDSISLIISIVTLILVWIGLRIWKIQLKGENTFKLSLDVLRELKLTLSTVDDYRNPFYSANETFDAFVKHNAGKSPDFIKDEDRKQAGRYAELDRWNNIITHYNTYMDAELKLAISLNDYNIDLVNGKRLQDYLIEIRNNRSSKEFADDEKEELGSLDIEERKTRWKELGEKYKKISSVLYRSSDDNWGKSLEQYFEEINKRLRRYIK